jgi:hypothetical protein
MATDIQTPVGSAPVVPVVLIGIGAYLAWFGVHYFGSDQGKWPSTPVKAVLTGKPLPQPTGQLTTGVIDQQVSSNTPAGSPAGTGATVPPGTPSGTRAQNQAIAKMLAVSMGHANWTTGSQWDDWVKLWDSESGWDATAYFPGSHTTSPDDAHAFGIPQALPASKMADPSQGGGPDYKTNPVTQIRWGITYIAQRYGSPSAAWAFHLTHNSY